MERRRPSGRVELREARACFLATYRARVAFRQLFVNYSRVRRWGEATRGQSAAVLAGWFGLVWFGLFLFLFLFWYLFVIVLTTHHTKINILFNRCFQLRRPALKQPLSRIIGIPNCLWMQMEHDNRAPDTDSRVVMWSYLRQHHPKKAEELAVKVIDEARDLFNQHDEAWNTQLKLMVSNVRSHMKIDLECFSPLDGVQVCTEWSRQSVFQYFLFHLDFRVGSMLHCD
jgi:hypothetical protein